MDTLYAAILGIVEGFTEFLPISSTGHLILVSYALGLPETEFLKSFEISIQLGAILAVVFLYWRRIFLDWEVVKRVMIAFFPTVLIGAIAYKQVKILLGSQSVVLWSLLIGGIILIIFEWWHHENEAALEEIATLSYPAAFGIGLFQSIAMIPGVSRSGATIIGGLLLGLKRKTIVEFSFLLAIPTMAAATSLDLWKNAGSFSSGDFSALMVGFFSAFFMAILAVKFLLRFIENHTFILFGIYRVALALFFFLLVL